MKKLNQFLHRRIGIRVNREVFLSSFELLFDFKKFFLLGKMEIVGQFGSTTLGAFWQPITTGVIVFGVGFIFGNLFKMNVEEYIPFFAVSLVLWFFLTQTLQEFSGIFSRSGEYQHVPYKTLILYPMQVMSKNLFIVALNLIVVAVVLIMFRYPVGPLNIFVAFLGLLIFAGYLFFLGLILSILGSRFFDIPNIVMNFLQAGFYITPVMWRPESISHDWVYLYNPLYYLFTLVRVR